MKADITRDVISDLWPLFSAGEASADSGRIIEAFLAQDAEFRSLLEKSERVQRGLPNVRLSPDAELRLITLARDRIRLKAWIAGSAIAAFVLVALTALGGALFYALSGS